MDQYKISQTPTTPTKAPKGRKTKKPKLAKGYRQPKRTAVVLSPKLILGGLAIALALIFAGLAWAHWYNGSRKSQPTSSAAAARSGRKAPVVIPGPTFNTVTTAITNKNGDALSTLYARKVRIVKKGSTQNVNNSQVADLLNSLLSGADNPWNWHVQPSDLSAWQTGPYGQYFVGNVIVGESNNGLVISISVDSSGQIDTIFIAPVGDLTTPGTTGGTTGSTGTTGGTTDSTTTPTTPTTSNSSD